MLCLTAPSAFLCPRRGLRRWYWAARVAPPQRADTATGHRRLRSCKPAGRGRSRGLESLPVRFGNLAAVERDLGVGSLSACENACLRQRLIMCRVRSPVGGSDRDANEFADRATRVTRELDSP